METKIDTKKFTVVETAKLDMINDDACYVALAIRDYDGQLGELVWFDPDLTVDDGSNACNWDLADEFQTISVAATYYINSDNTEYSAAEYKKYCEWAQSQIENRFPGLSVEVVNEGSRSIISCGYPALDPYIQQFCDRLWDTSNGKF